MVALRVPRDVRWKRVIEVCSFCGRRESEAGRLVSGRSALICAGCAAEVTSLFAQASA